MIVERELGEKEVEAAGEEEEMKGMKRGRATEEGEKKEVEEVRLRVGGGSGEGD